MLDDFASAYEHCPDLSAILFPSKLVTCQGRRSSFASLCLSFVVLVGLLWSKKAPTWSQIVFGLTPQHPHHSKWCALSSRTVHGLSGPSYSIYESASATRLPTAPWLLPFLCPLFAISSTLATIVVTLSDSFCLPLVQLAGLFILFII
jgi:hypothetical protein